MTLEEVGQVLRQYGDALKYMEETGSSYEVSDITVDLSDLSFNFEKSIEEVREYMGLCPEGAAHFDYRCADAPHHY